ncbi:MAG: hypothetical protein MUF80_00090 [Burkholderiales bacterium]|jgi:hypothetical protein|nr:hypothetical protein [Burkholderiales bacterium]
MMKVTKKKIVTWSPADTIPSDYAEAVGYALQQWNLIEAQIELICADVMVGTDRRVLRLMLSQMSAQGKAKTLEGVAERYLSGAGREQARSLAKNVEKLSRKRNRLAHGFWCTRKGAPEEYGLYGVSGSVANRLLPEVHPETPTSIRRDGDDFREQYEAAKELSRLVKKPSATPRA